MQPLAFLSRLRAVIASNPGRGLGVDADGNPTAADYLLADGSVSLTGPLSAGNNQITNVASPTGSGHVMPRSYADARYDAAGSAAAAQAAADTADAAHLADHDHTIVDDLEALDILSRPGVFRWSAGDQAEGATAIVEANGGPDATAVNTEATHVDGTTYARLRATTAEEGYWSVPTNVGNNTLTGVEIRALIRNIDGVGEGTMWLVSDEGTHLDLRLRNDGAPTLRWQEANGGSFAGDFTTSIIYANGDTVRLRVVGTIGGDVLWYTRTDDEIGADTGWTLEGTNVGTGPASVDEIPSVGFGQSRWDAAIPSASLIRGDYEHLWWRFTTATEESTIEWHPARDAPSLADDPAGPVTTFTDAASGGTWSAVGANPARLVRRPEILATNQGDKLVTGFTPQITGARADLVILAVTSPRSSPGQYPRHFSAESATNVGLSLYTNTATGSLSAFISGATGGSPFASVSGVVPFDGRTQVLGLTVRNGALRAFYDGTFSGPADITGITDEIECSPLQFFLPPPFVSNGFDDSSMHELVVLDRTGVTDAEILLVSDALLRGRI